MVPVLDPPAPAAPDWVAKPIIWSIAGNDSGGGAGLSADQRAAEAFGVHLCPVVAAITAQSSVGVARVEAVSPEVLDAQLAALADDMPPAAIKTGLLGSAGTVAVVARWVDKLRERAPVALVVDPVLGASTGKIVQLLVWQFTRPVLIANLIAWPVAWWVMRDWLNGFDSRIALTPLPFLLAGGLALLIAILTIGAHSFRVARTNPIHALRYE